MNRNELETYINLQSSWIDELIRWENTHPEYQSFREDSDSQRQQFWKETND